MSSTRAFHVPGIRFVSQSARTHVGRRRADVVEGGKRVFVALGSNIGDRARMIRDAVERLQPLGTVASTSFLYQSRP
jgi:hypothetical protein